MSAEVLNGTVDVGDRVAYGVRDGSSGGIRAGVVLEIEEFPVNWDWLTRQHGDFTGYTLKIQVEHSSQSWSLKRPTRVSNMSRVVKL